MITIKAGDMKLKEALELSIDYGLDDLMALIMLLAFEKKVVDLEGPREQLDLYFANRHKGRMNQELRAYKYKAGINDSMKMFELESTEGETLYILARDLREAETMFFTEGKELARIEVCLPFETFDYNGVSMEVKDIIKGRDKPEVLGGF